LVHDNNHAIYLAETFDVKAQAVDTKAQPLMLQNQQPLAFDRAGCAMTGSV